jgi:hypothetical protein
MKEAAITIADDLIDALEAYQRDHGGPADLPAVTDTALRAFLRERGYLPSRRSLQITPACQGSGTNDVSISIEHDRELAAE